MLQRWLMCYCIDNLFIKIWVYCAIASVSLGASGILGQGLWSISRCIQDSLHGNGGRVSKVTPRVMDVQESHHGQCRSNSLQAETIEKLFQVLRVILSSIVSILLRIGIWSSIGMVGLGLSSWVGQGSESYMHKTTSIAYTQSLRSTTTQDLGNQPALQLLHAQC